MNSLQHATRSDPCHRRSRRGHYLHEHGKHQMWSTPQSQQYTEAELFWGKSSMFDRTTQPAERINNFERRGFEILLWIPVVRGGFWQRLAHLATNGLTLWSQIWVSHFTQESVPCCECCGWKGRGGLRWCPPAWGSATPGQGVGLANQGTFTRPKRPGRAPVTCSRLLGRQLLPQPCSLSTGDTRANLLSF